MKRFLTYSPFLLLVILAAGCKKDTLLKNSAIHVGNFKGNDAANYNFDWETATEMPVSPSASYDPAMPWQSQSGSYIDPALIDDYKKSDGWELVYNTFNTTVNTTASGEPSGGLYFALYNRFRGLLRFYLYIPPGLFGNSADIEHGLSLYTNNGSTSSMLNFEGTDLIDPNVNITSFTKTNNSGVAVGGGWYVMQYEIAYDPNFAATTYPNLGFSWDSRTENISEITLAGTQTGTISGNITQQTGGFSLTSALKDVGSAAAEIYGVLNPSKTGTTFLSRLSTAAGSGLAGNISGFFNGIFGGSSTSTQEVDLKMNTSISLAGTLTASQPLDPNTLVVPGQSVANTVNAPVPLYTSPLGVFNLTARPTIIETTRKTYVTNNGRSDYVYQNAYDVDNTSFSQIFVPNPAVIGTGSDQAQIKNLKEEVVILNPQIDANTQINQGNQETIGNYTAITGTYVETTYTEPRIQPANSDVAVRVSFNVVPNNGAPSVLIVKTFLANLQQQPG